MEKKEKGRNRKRKRKRETKILRDKKLVLNDLRILLNYGICVLKNRIKESMISRADLNENTKWTIDSLESTIKEKKR